MPNYMHWVKCHNPRWRMWRLVDANWCIKGLLCRNTLAAFFVKSRPVGDGPWQHAVFTITWACLIATRVLTGHYRNFNQFFSTEMILTVVVCDFHECLPVLVSRRSHNESMAITCIMNKGAIDIKPNTVNPCKFCIFNSNSALYRMNMANSNCYHRGQ